MTDTAKQKIKMCAIKYKTQHPNVSLRDVAQHVYDNVDHTYSFRSVYDFCKPQSLAEIQDKKPVDIFQDEDNGQITEEEKPYFYNATDKVYMVFSPWRARPLIVPEAQHLAILREYSNFDGMETSLNRMCETFGFDKAEMRWYLKVFNQTHDSLPFSDEEIHSSTDEQLVARGLQMRRGAIRRKLQKKEWEDTIKLAELGKSFQLQSKIIVDSLKDALLNSKPIDFKPIKYNDNASIVDVIGLYDLHFGKTSVNGESNESIIPYLKDMINNSNSKECILVFGGDTFNVDTLSGKTTKDTPQNNDSIPIKFISNGWREIIEIIKLCSVYKTVKIVVIPGNHDLNVSIHMNSALKELIDWVSQLSGHDMSVVSDGRNMVVVSFGVNMFVFHHGDLYKKEKFSTVLLSKFRKIMATSIFRYSFSGHNHHTKITTEVDDGGIINFQHPSPTLADQWHDDQGYVGSTPAIRINTFHKEYGHISTQNRNMMGHLQYE